jgi:hypothetical protein
MAVPDIHNGGILYRLGMCERRTAHGTAKVLEFLTF